MNEQSKRAALADRIEIAPAYSGKELGRTLYRCDDPEQLDSHVDVILVNAEHRRMLVEALRK